MIAGGDIVNKRTEFRLRTAACLVGLGATKDYCLLIGV